MTPAKRAYAARHRDKINARNRLWYARNKDRTFARRRELARKYQLRRHLNHTKALCHPELAHAAHGLCAPCYMRQYRREYVKREDVRAKQRHRNWRRRGIPFTVAEYNARFLRQGGRCAICERPPPSRALAVDHDHDTGRVRGLLCDYCNRKLLISRNTLAVLQRAVAYLTPP